MRTIIYNICVIIIATMILMSCNDLDLQSKGQIDQTALFSSDYGVKKYLTKPYDDMPFEDWNYGECDGDKDCARGYAGINGLDGEGAGRAHRWSVNKNSPSSVAGEALGWGKRYGSSYTFWMYDYIRYINTFIVEFPDFAFNFSKEDADNFMGEAYFLRACYYFAMVKRMGGVPLIEKPLDPTAPMEELQVPRDTEYDSWKFIHNDLVAARELLHYDNGLYRANKYVAAALDSRVCLYAGTTAKYNPYYVVDGPATQAGLMKMEGDDIAKEFLEYAVDAARFVNQGPYALHTGADKAQAFAEIFITNTEEDILKRPGLYANSAGEQVWHFNNNWDCSVLPKYEGLSGMFGCMLTPTFEAIMLFEHPDIVDADGYPVRFKSRSDFWKSDEMEPRAMGSMFFCGMVEPCSGVEFDFQNGFFDECNLTAEELCPESNGEDIPYIAQHRRRSELAGDTYKGQKVTGLHGGALQNAMYCHSAACIRKYIDPNATVSERQIEKGKLPFKLMRYGEIVCNEMEAAYELYLYTGNSTYLDEAQQCLNRLRDRAGAHPHQLIAGGGEDVGSAEYGIPIDENLQYIRDERGRELMFENHKMFDLRRWRIFDRWADSRWMHMLAIYYIQDEDAYIFVRERDTYTNCCLTFKKRYYYEQVKYEPINPNIIKNDGY